MRSSEKELLDILSDEQAGTESNTQAMLDGLNIDNAKEVDDFVSINESNEEEKKQDSERKYRRGLFENLTSETELMMERRVDLTGTVEGLPLKEE